jgi:hypothetical protein
VLWKNAGVAAITNAAVANFNFMASPLVSKPDIVKFKITCAGQLLGTAHFVRLNVSSSD